jgi:hypothetical protein
MKIFVIVIELEKLVLLGFPSPRSWIDNHKAQPGGRLPTRDAARIAQAAAPIARGPQSAPPIEVQRSSSPLHPTEALAHHCADEPSGHDRHEPAPP